MLINAPNLLMEKSSEDCVIGNSDSSVKAQPKDSYSYSTSRKISRFAYSDLGINISDSFNILERKNLSADYLRDFWTGDRNQDTVVKPTSKFAEQRLFLICESCFWCASYFRSGYLMHDCPMCYNGKLNCMPIGDDEEYRFDNSLTTGAEVQFSNDILMWSRKES